MSLAETVEFNVQDLKKLLPKIKKGLNIDISALCRDRWQFADTCREMHDSGMCISSIALLTKYSETTIENWIKTSETFPPEYRFEEITPSAYLHLLKMPDPIEPIQEMQNRIETLEAEKQFLLKELRIAKNQRDIYMRELERKRLLRVS